jgi:hypothetical protein
MFARYEKSNSLWYIVIGFDSINCKDVDLDNIDEAIVDMVEQNRKDNEVFEKSKILNPYYHGISDEQKAYMAEMEYRILFGEDQPTKPKSTNQ